MRERKEYAIYKGDKFIDLGTREYLAKRFSVTEKYISFLASPTARKRGKQDDSNKLIAVKIEDDEEEIKC